MKTFWGIAAASTFTLVLAAFGPSARSVAAAAPIPPFPQGGPTINCSSDDMRQHYCDADTRGGVQLLRQHSEAPCTFGSTWGYDDRGIWVDRGCRADFLLGSSNWGGYGETYTIYCASDDGDRNTCPTDTRNGVRLARQRSGADCIFGRTWGYSRDAIWVDRGCRADFELGGGSGSAWNNLSATLPVYCASDDMGRHVCPVDTRGGVRMIRQRSGSDCIYRRTWGFDGNGIWVDRGCRADFEVGGDGDADDFPLQSLYCASDDGHRRSCPVDARGGVRLTKQRSGSPCEYGRTWGYSAREIWVDRGCRADFEVGGHSSWGGDRNRNRDRDRDHDRDRDRNQGSYAAPQSIYCASDDGGRHTCPIDTRGGVRLTKQHSGSPCDYGRTWGYDDNGIWVDRGCRADFETGGSH